MKSFSRIRFEVEGNVEAFCRRHVPAYFWSLTFKENLIDKKEAQKRFRCLCDLIRRRKGSYYGIWEEQDRGAWHLHLLTDVYFEWHWLQAWLVARGWGEQLWVRKAEPKIDDNGQVTWKPLAIYMCKYLTKDMHENTQASYYQQ